MKQVLVLAAIVAVALGDTTCPAFNDWREWTNCLWFPLNNLRADMISACDINLDVAKLPQMPVLEGMPDKCGHCSFKARCRKRGKQDGCFPINIEHQQCHEHADICAMPKFPKYNLGCRYEFANAYLRQCSARADFPDWMSDAKRDIANVLPQFHCVDKDDACACCCHPYHPNADGTACLEHSESTCEPWSEWNDFSEECVWLPPKAMRQAYQDHCDFDVAISEKAKKVYDKLNKLPNGEDFPARCGYCSYKIKCRKRSPMSGTGKKECFPLDVEKKNCGAESGEGYDTICDLPKMLGSCNFTEQLHKLAGKGHGSRYKKLPMGMKMGITKLGSLLPHGKCVTSGDRCKCCCHPYEPNADATGCQIKNMCKNAKDVGVEWDLGLPDEGDAWF